eukprot:TRINITY_DN124209_c0_g1_i1.p1 TRINITY_DN124209_c0_g1~~TRINITY_DN124209_c0_g1_i1.p1  ORF type:complete len:171 (-),score=60.46 TRINITY_DN124209_c0_g1_i1:105-617(-)
MVKTLDETDFLAQLGDIYANCREKGSVYIGMKRYVGKNAHIRRKNFEKMMAYAEEPLLLVRARHTREKWFSKIRTIVKASDLTRFQMAMGNCMTLNMDGLRLRKETAEDKPELKKKKTVKKAGTPPPKVKKNPELRKKERAEKKKKNRARREEALKRLKAKQAAEEQEAA